MYFSISWIPFLKLKKLIEANFLADKICFKEIVIFHLSLSVFEILDIILTLVFKSITDCETDYIETLSLIIKWIFVSLCGIKLIINIYVVYLCFMEIKTIQRNREITTAGPMLSDRLF